MVKRTGAIIFCVFWIILVFNGCASMSYKSAVKSNTIEEYDKFLDEYGDSEYVSDVKKRKEKLVWEKAKNNNSFVAYKSYIEKYSQGRYFPDALVLLKKTAEKLDGNDYINAQKYIEYYEIKKNPDNFVDISISSYQLNKDTSEIQGENLLLSLGSSGIQDIVKPIIYLQVKSKAKYCTFSLRIKIHLTQEGYIRYRPLLGGWQRKNVKEVHEANSYLYNIVPQSSTKDKVEFKKLRVSGAQSSWGSSAEIKTKFTDIRTSFHTFDVLKPM